MPVNLPRTRPSQAPARVATPKTQKIKVDANGFQDPACDLSLPPRLGRPPTTRDLIIKKTWDGKTPQQAAKTIRDHLMKVKVWPGNEQIVTTMIDARVRDLAVALNNVFTPKTPNRQFIDGLKPTKVEVLASTTAIVYRLTDKNNVQKCYTRDWSGRYVEMSAPPKFVVMSAELRLTPPGLKMSYPDWSAPALAGPLTTITEL